jgi:hypothetical protein
MSHRAIDLQGPRKLVYEGVTGVSGRRHCTTLTLVGGPSRLASVQTMNACLRRECKGYGTLVARRCPERIAFVLRGAMEGMSTADL